MADGICSSRHPALAPSLAFVAGVAAAKPPATPAVCVALAIAGALGGWLLREHRRGFIAAALVAAGGIGGARGLAAAADAERRGLGWIPIDGAPVELEIEGRVARSPEKDAEGAWRIALLASPARAPGAPAVRCLVRVEPVPEERAAALGGLLRGDRIRCWARVRRSESGSLADARATVKNARLVERLSVGDASVARGLDRLRAWLRRRLAEAFPADARTRGVLGAMVLGDRANLDDTDLRDLRDGGLLHLLSISGLHVGLLVALLAGGLRRGPWACPWGIAAAAIPAVAALAFLTGGEAPVARSALTASAALAGRALGRRGNALNSLALASAALVAWDPALLDDVSFRLTFTATAGLVVFAGPIARGLPLPAPISLPLGVSAGAYVGTAPVSAWSFGRLAPAGLLTNLLSAPLCAGVMALGCGAVVLQGVPVAGAAAAAAAAWSVRAMFAVCRFGAALPGGAFHVAAPSLALLAAYAAALAALGPDPATADAGNAARLRRFALGALLVALHVGPAPARGGAVAFTVFDVGQGQAVSWRGPSGGWLLVDAGPGGEGRFDAGARVVVPGLYARGCRRLEALVLTHDHDDHTGGARAVIREMDVGEIWIAAGAATDALTAGVVDLALSRGVAVRLVARGDRLPRAGGWVEVLHPTRADRTRPTNDRGVVVRLTAPGQPSALVPGDAEAGAEARILASGSPVGADLLVAGHHGAANSTTAAFAAAVRPAVAVFSAGRFNRFGHPSRETVRRLRAIPRWRTDRDGTVDLLADDSGWRAEATDPRPGWARE